MDNLKPCPFCGGTDFVFFEIPSKDGSVIWHNLVHFPENPCSISIMGGDKAEVIERWNTRADDQRTVKLIEAASKVVTTMVAVSQEGVPYEKHVDAVVEMNLAIEAFSISSGRWECND